MQVYIGHVESPQLMFEIPISLCTFRLFAPSYVLSYILMQKKDLLWDALASFKQFLWVRNLEWLF